MVAFLDVIELLRTVLGMIVSTTLEMIINLAYSLNIKIQCDMQEEIVVQLLYD